MRSAASCSMVITGVVYRAPQGDDGSHLFLKLS
jgi:hypothetical protein